MTDRTGVAGDTERRPSVALDFKSLTTLGDEHNEKTEKARQERFDAARSQIAALLNKPLPYQNGDDEDEGEERTIRFVETLATVAVLLRNPANAGVIDALNQPDVLELLKRFGQPNGWTLDEGRHVVLDSNGVPRPDRGTGRHQQPPAAAVPTATSAAASPAPVVAVPAQPTVPAQPATTATPTPSPQPVQPASPATTVQTPPIPGQPASPAPTAPVGPRQAPAPRGWNGRRRQPSANP